MKKQTLIQHLISMIYGAYILALSIGLYFHFQPSEVFGCLLFGIFLPVVGIFQFLLEEGK